MERKLKGNWGLKIVLVNQWARWILSNSETVLCFRFKTPIVVFQVNRRAEYVVYIVCAFARVYWSPMYVGVCLYSIFAKLVCDKMLLICETYNVLVLKPLIYFCLALTTYLRGNCFIAFFEDNHNILSWWSFIITTAEHLRSIFWTE